MSEPSLSAPNATGKNLVDRAYEDAMSQLGGIGRLKRGFALYQFAYNVLHHQIQKQRPELSEREIKIEIARRMYLSDPQAQMLLKRLAES